LTQLGEIVPVQPDGGAIWNDCMRLYHEAFPPWERESDRLLERRMAKGRYLMRAGLKNEQAVGFYVLDVEEDGQPYALLSYLAVAEAERGQGYGEQLTRHAIGLFLERGDRDWLLIEAEDRQARFYGRIGFAKLGFDYYVPRYGDAGAVPMHLLAIAKKGRRPSVAGKALKPIIERVYRDSYKLDADDPRLVKQLALIPDEVRLLDWPPEASEKP
jgi:ribosomal protein S18 acetylase RimI-like enzyme